MVSPLSIRIIIIEPTAAGNVGWIARAMANFGLSDLVLVNPRTFDIALSREFSCHGSFIIDTMKIVSSFEEALDGIVFAVGTTRRISSKEQSLSARQAAPVIVDRASAAPAALVFGRESSGLSKEEKNRCNILSYITTVEGPKGSLNISHAAALFLYEIQEACSSGAEYPGADLSAVDEAFDRALSHSRTYMKNGSYQKIMKSVLGRAHLSKEESERLASAFSLIAGGKGNEGN
jgi:TrmH family RNA methyltransferase